MTLPGFVAGVVIATLFGAAFHLWQGGNGLRFIYYILLSWLGFWGGHFLGNALGWTFLSLGPLRLGMAVFGTVIFLVGGYWLSLFKPNPPE